MCLERTNLSKSLSCLHQILISINPLPNDKVLDMTKLKVFADDKLNVARMIPLLDRVENTVRKGENAGYQHFLLFLECFPKPSSLGSLKVRIVWKRNYSSISAKNKILTSLKFESFCRQNI